MPSVSRNGDGTLLLVGSEDSAACLIDIKTLKELQLFKGHTWFVYSVALSPDGATVLTGSDDCTARLWTQGESIRPLTTKEEDSNQLYMECYLT